MSRSSDHHVQDLIKRFRTSLARRTPTNVRLSIHLSLLRLFRIGRIHRGMNKYVEMDYYVEREERAEYANVCTCIRFWLSSIEERK